jgi:hypothetical protein
MSENNTYLGETKEQRTRRFQNGPPIEIIDTVINSIHNFFLNELRDVFVDKKNAQTSLMFLGTHSIALTISYGFFNKDGMRGYKLFLKNFVDGEQPDKVFSTIAEEIHEWRNVIAHRWINVAGHSIEYDFNMQEGWKKDGEFLIINPHIYLEQFLKAFDYGRVYEYKNALTSSAAQQGAKERFISKYEDSA